VIGLILGIGYVLLVWALGGTGPRSSGPANHRNTAAA
jgi:hypothetical protein